MDIITIAMAALLALTFLAHKLDLIGYAWQSFNCFSIVILGWVAVYLDISCGG